MPQGDWYDEVAREVLDRVHEFGACHIVRVARPDELRSHIRAEGRRRRQRLRTVEAGGGDHVYVWTDHPTPEAAAYRIVAASMPPVVSLPGWESEEPPPSIDRTVIEVNALGL